MWHTFKHFIHIQCLLLPTNLVIVFVHWVSTVVCCTNPDNVHWFGTIFPNLIFVFASICAARPVLIKSDQYRSCSTVNKVNKVTTRDRCSRHSSRWGATKNSAVALSSRNNNKYEIYFVKIIFLPSTWTCGHALLKTVLKLIIYWNIIDLLMLRIITVAVLVILVEFRLYVVFCCNILWYTVATFSWFLRRVAAIGNILGKETRQVVCPSRGLLRWYSWENPWHN